MKTSIVYEIIGLICFGTSAIYSAFTTKLNHEIFFGIAAIIMILISIKYNLREEEC